MSALADAARLAARVADGGDQATGQELARLVEAIEGELKVAYPYREGGVTVIGPECFVALDGSVLSWKGVNYVTQEVAVGVSLSREGAGQVAELVAHCDMRVLDAGGEFVPERLKAVLDLYDAAEEAGVLGPDARVAVGMRAERDQPAPKPGDEVECSCRVVEDGDDVGTEVDPQCPAHGVGKS